MIASASLLFHWVRTTDVDPKAMPSEWVMPPVGRKRETAFDRPTSPSPTPPHAPASGADDATTVRASAAATVIAMNPAPPRRYTVAIEAGSPIRRRSHSDCSSKTCARMSSRSAARVNTTRMASWLAKVIDMLATSRTPTTTTALSVRRCPKTAYDANIEVAQISSPMISA